MDRHDGRAHARWDCHETNEDATIIIITHKVYTLHAATHILHTPLLHAHSFDSGTEGGRYSENCLERTLFSSSDVN
jgi:hypothetical protein